MDELLKQYEQKKSLYEIEKQKLIDQNIEISDSTKNSNLVVIKEEVDFFEKVISVVKEFKNS